MRAGFPGADSAAAGIGVALLKSWDFADWRSRSPGGTQLPFRMDYLEDHGFRLSWTDALHSRFWQGSSIAAPLHLMERLAFPFVQTVLMRQPIRRSPVVFSMFESEANALAMARSVRRRRCTPALVVMTCWLAQILATCSPARRAGYRWAYRGVDRLYYLSENQGAVLAEHLRCEPEKLRFLPFGIDEEEFVPSEAPDQGYVLVVGRDKGRDWTTTFEALRNIGIPVKVCCRPEDLAGICVPDDIEILGYVDRDRYRELLGHACVVVVSTRPLLYPTGQTVLLESMAMKRAVVVSGTPALAGYVRDGITALAVPPGDPRAIREQVLRAAGDSRLRRDLGDAGRRAVEAEFSARVMWEKVALDLLGLLKAKPDCEGS